VSTLAEFWIPSMLKSIFFETRSSRDDFTIGTSVISHDSYGLMKLKNAKPNVEVILDIGAHIGCFTEFSKLLWPDAEVICFEPEKDNFSLLSKNCSSLHGVQIVNAAIIGPEERDWRLNTDHPSSGGPRMQANGAYSVPTMTIDEVFARFGLKYIDILKLDCEGMEVSILEDAKRNRLLPMIDYIPCEFHKEEYVAKIKEILQETHTIKTARWNGPYWGILQAERK
jgi:FkbM family methyltransferase